MEVMDFKKAYIALGSAAVILLIIAYIVVFAPGTYELAGTNTNGNGSGTLSLGQLAQGGTSTLPADSASSSASGSIAFPIPIGQSGVFVTNFSYPYIVNWSEGQNSFSITGAQVTATQIAFAVKVQVGSAGGCIPVNIGLVIDESGDIEPANQTQFTFPDTKSCNGTPGATYSKQTVTFSLSAVTPSPYLFTTGGASNQFFQVSTSTGSAVQIQLPSTSG